jgi:hypothetical protein
MRPAAERIVDKIAKAPGTDMGLQQAAPLTGTPFNPNSLALEENRPALNAKGMN